jgi:hypothetical protein
VPLPAAAAAAGESDPLEGLSPAQIVKFLEIHKIDPDDPLEVRPAREEFLRCSSNTFVT